MERTARPTGAWLAFLRDVFHDCAHLLRVLNQMIFFIDADRRQSSGASHGVAVVSEAT